MKAIYILLFTLLFFSCTGSNNNDKVFYGSYIYKSGDTSYEVFELNADHTFNSWLHHKPASSGTWLLKDNTIHIKEDGFEQETKIKPIKIDDTEVVFKFDGMNKPATFDKTKP